MAATVDRVIRSVDIDVADAGRFATAIDQMYDDQLDVLLVRRALEPQRLAAVGEYLDRDDANAPWARPNARMPIEDIQVLGSDVPATPTYSAPTGASLDAYLESAKGHTAATAGLFDAGFDVTEAFRRVLGRFAGGRDVDIPVADDGRKYVPFTIRRLTDGKQIGLHHDYHYPLALYNQLAPTLDTRTLISFVVTLRRAEAGGDLVVYAVTPDTPNAPKMPNGFQWDQEALERRFAWTSFQTNPGDLFLLASGRCLHRIARISGPRARISMGGFLALDKAGLRVLYWS
jgi:hypothetical protein